MNLHSRVCEILEIEKPIVLAGMGGASSPALAAAVSNAGGLGVLGAAGCGPNQLRRWIRETRELTDRPFGVDTLLPASVRRANYEDMEGPTPADLLPERKDFAAQFMAKEGLEPVDAGISNKTGARRPASSSLRNFLRPRWRSSFKSGFLCMPQVWAILARG
jgi:NAD(P)H-dependent flavin oxidoreductase YrpB (nitropropane dioxygenase family)